MLRRVTRFGAISVLCILLTAGCDSIVEPPAGKMSPPVSSQTPTSTTPAEAAPVMPEEAKQATPAGAEAFVRFFIQTVNYGYRTSDSSKVVELSGPDCAACQDYTRVADKRRSEGITVTDGDVTIRSLTVKSFDASHAVVVIEWRQGAAVASGNGQPPVTRKPGQGQAEFSLGHRNGTWYVEHWGQPSA